MNALPFSIAVHGGAGTITRRELTPALEAQYRAGITSALAAGHAILDVGGSSVDAVEAAVRVLEDDPLFNAGKGAVFTHAGTVELDAAIMDGATGRAGAVAGVTTLRNPVTAARAVMERSRHVLLIGAGAEAFAQLHGIAQVDPGYFHTERRWQQLQRAIAADRVELDHDGSARAAANASADPDERKFGTVGAVARDRHGHLAAATSTGGVTNKLYGRVGDSPIVGAGTYAEDGVVAVSATGSGEFFMRGVVAHDIAARMKYGGMGVQAAVAATIAAALTAKGGDGGVIAVDATGEAVLAFNTEGMYRGVWRAGGDAEVAVYRDETR